MSTPIHPMLDFNIQWSEPAPIEGACDGSVSVVLSGKSVWSVRWSLLDLLEHMADVWPWLLGETWPVELDCLRPGDFLGAVKEALWRTRDPDTRSRLEERFWGFREAHDLSFGLKGASTAPLWVVRVGEQGWLGDTVLPWSEIESALVRFGDELAQRAGALEQPRNAAAVEAWARREDVSSDLLAAILTDLSPEVLQDLAGEEDLMDFLELEAIAPSELSVVLRQSAALPSDAQRKMLRCIQEAPPTAIAAELVDLARRAGEAFQPCEKPYDEGYWLALWLREELGLEDGRRVDVDGLLRGWGVKVETVNLGDVGIDAFACWGARHGPAIYVNKMGLHARKPAGRRTTLAHEVAHLLLDRGAAYPLSEVQGAVSYADKWVETRASTFAAEFLVPRKLVRTAMEGSRDRIKELTSLASRYQVSHSLLAWHALNAESQLPREAWAAMSQKVNDPEEFLRKVQRLDRHRALS